MRTAHRIFRPPGDLDRIEACLSGAAFAPHRHDTYVIGVTLKGIQSFDYRGATRHSRPGQFVILYPDERHDGRAGDGRVFQYRTAYIAPAAIQRALGGRPLPFIGGVCSNVRLRGPIYALLHAFDRPLTRQAQDDAIYDLATALNEVAGGSGNTRTVNRAAAASARDYIEARLCEDLSLNEFQSHFGRQFKAAFGLTPNVWRRAMLALNRSIPADFA